MRRLLLLLALPALLLFSACNTVKVDPIEVKPIHITVDVNVKIEKELNDFFSDLDASNDTLNFEPSAMVID